MVVYSSNRSVALYTLFAVRVLHYGIRDYAPMKTPPPFKNFAMSIKTPIDWCSYIPAYIWQSYQMCEHTVIEELRAKLIFPPITINTSIV